ncbi:hypothetical protein PE067_08215 [Paracoccus sp. DMF-8]|uniref:hypothetical protein n=1 Tax=Paracoccus sp. DMF-8 TaxID=3019445 RepID=UPI0023E776E5|nr:hypothetical protein [Paracoccus sp. DMF-8]MDF3606112.1 hypothetical protein [Paracoccus sp. DMF-8]
MTALSAKPLFRAISGQGSTVKEPLPLLPDAPVRTRPRVEVRREHDFYPTGQPEAIRGLLARDGDAIRACGSVWEPACGDGALVREIRDFGLPCIATDLIDRGCPDSDQADFFECDCARAPAVITNPPFNLINARDGHGRWLRHTLDMPGWRYLALLLSWDWPAARANGLGALLDQRPFSYCYLMRWKLDFTGEGSPPQRNAWFVWDRDYEGSEPAFRFMDRADGEALRQEVLI